MKLYKWIIVNQVSIKHMPQLPLWNWLCRKEWSYVWLCKMTPLNGWLYLSGLPFGFPIYLEGHQKRVCIMTLSKGQWYFYNWPTRLFDIIRYKYKYIYTYIFMIYVSAFSIYKQKQTCSENLYQPSSKRFKFRPKALPPTLADGCASHPHGYQSAWHSAAHVGRALPRRNLWQSRGCPWRMEVVLKPKYEIHRNSIWVWLFPMTHGIQNQCIYIHIVYRCIL